MPSDGTCDSRHRQLATNHATSTDDFQISNSSSDRSPKCGSQVITAGTCAIRRHFRLSSSPARYKPQNINRGFSNSSSDRSPKCGSQVITAGTCAIRRHFRLSSSPARYKPQNINRRFSNSSSDRSPKCGSQVITAGTCAIRRHFRLCHRQLSTSHRTSTDDF